MAKPRQELNWAEIRREYINSDTTYKALADKYNVSLSAIAKRARGSSKKKGWALLKEEKRKRVENNVQKNIEKIEVSKTLSRIKKLNTLTDDLLNACIEATAELKKVGKINKNGKVKIYEGLPINTKSLMSISKAAKNIKDIISEDDNAGDESGVIILPQKDILTPPEDDEDSELLVGNDKNGQEK